MRFTDPQTAIAALNAKGIESGIMGTYFGDEVYVHIYGDSVRALIHPNVKSFMGWVNAVDYDSLTNKPQWDEDSED